MQSVDKISVTDIVKRAGAGRQTFYNHFKDKNDLLYWIYKRTLIGEKETIQNEGFYAYLCSVYRNAQKKYSNFLKEDPSAADLTLLREMALMTAPYADAGSDVRKRRRRASGSKSSK